MSLCKEGKELRAPHEPETLSRHLQCKGRLKKNLFIVLRTEEKNIFCPKEVIGKQVCVDLQDGKEEVPDN